MIFVYTLFIVFFVIGLFGSVVLSIEEGYQFFKRRKRVKAIQNMLPDVVDENRMCSIHSWSEVPALNEQGLAVDIQVCNTCGFIPTRNSMLPISTLNTMNVKLKQLEWEENVIKQFARYEDEQLKAIFATELESGMDFKKASEAYMAGQTMQERFIIFRLGQLEGKSNE